MASMFTETCKNIAYLMTNVEKLFGGTVLNNIVFIPVTDSNDSPTCTVEIRVPVSRLSVIGFTSPEFEKLCSSMEMNGVIYFNEDSTVTFSMTPKGNHEI